MALQLFKADIGELIGPLIVVIIIISRMVSAAKRFAGKDKEPEEGTASEPRQEAPVVRDLEAFLRSLTEAPPPPPPAMPLPVPVAQPVRKVPQPIRQATPQPVPVAQPIRPATQPIAETRPIRQAAGPRQVSRPSSVAQHAKMAPIRPIHSYTRTASRKPVSVIPSLSAASPAQQLFLELQTRNSLQKAVLFREILGPPKAMS